MDGSAIWFLVAVALGVGGWLAGLHAARRWSWVGRSMIFASLVMLIAWAWLQRHPAVAVQVMPVGVLSRFEGVGGVPLFMMICGAAWALCGKVGQRRLILAASCFGGLYLLQGGLWMLQVTPASALGVQPSPDVRQSEDWSCVPAASATALNLIGYPSSESQMAQLVRARPGTGATTVRALDGLRQRLRGTPHRAELVAADYQTLLTMPMPSLTPLQFEPTQRHMVTLIDVNAKMVTMIDPTFGPLVMSRIEFEEVYREELIVLRRRD